MADIFISYKREDEILAKALAQKLTALGWSVWWDQNILAGKDYDRIIEEALVSSKCVIVLWSERSLLSRNVKDEANEALLRSVYIPVLIGNVRQPYGFRMIQAVKWNDNNNVEEEEMYDLLKNITHLLGEPPLKEHQKKVANELKVNEPSAKSKSTDNSKNETASPVFEESGKQNEIILENKKNSRREKLLTILKALEGKHSVCIYPVIPQAKIDAISEFLTITGNDSLRSEKILALIDLTFWGGCKSYVAFTENCLLYQHTVQDIFFHIHYYIMSISEIRKGDGNEIFIGEQKITVDYHTNEIFDVLTKVQKLIINENRSIPITYKEKLRKIFDSRKGDFFVYPDIPSQSIDGVLKTLARKKILIPDVRSNLLAVCSNDENYEEYIAYTCNEFLFNSDSNFLIYPYDLFLEEPDDFESYINSIEFEGLSVLLKEIKNFMIENPI